MRAGLSWRQGPQHHPSGLQVGPAGGLQVTRDTDISIPSYIPQLQTNSTSLHPSTSSSSSIFLGVLHHLYPLLLFWWSLFDPHLLFWGSQLTWHYPHLEFSLDLHITTYNVIVMHYHSNKLSSHPSSWIFMRQHFLGLWPSDKFIALFWW